MEVALSWLWCIVFNVCRLPAAGHESAVDIQKSLTALNEIQLVEPPAVPAAQTVTEAGSQPDSSSQKEEFVRTHYYNSFYLCLFIFYTLG
jgi:hypothetical protein